MLTLQKMGKTNNCDKSKNLSNLSQNVLYSKDVPLDVETKVENGVTNALLNPKKKNTNQTLSKLTGNFAVPPCSESTYEVCFQGLTKIFKIKMIGDYESFLMLHNRCLANCPPMKVESLVIYVWWK